MTLNILASKISQIEADLLVYASGSKQIHMGQIRKDIHHVVQDWKKLSKKDQECLTPELKDIVLLADKVKQSRYDKKGMIAKIFSVFKRCLNPYEVVWDLTKATIHQQKGSEAKLEAYQVIKETRQDFLRPIKGPEQPMFDRTFQGILSGVENDQSIGKVHGFIFRILKEKEMEILKLAREVRIAERLGKASRSEDLKKEIETVQSQIDSLKSLLPKIPNIDSDFLKRLASLLDEINGSCEAVEGIEKEIPKTISIRLIIQSHRRVKKEIQDLFIEGDDSLLIKIELKKKQIKKNEESLLKLTALEAIEIQGELCTNKSPSCSLDERSYSQLRQGFFKIIRILPYLGGEDYRWISQAQIYLKEIEASFPIEQRKFAWEHLDPTLKKIDKLVMNIDESPLEGEKLEELRADVLRDMISFLYKVGSEPLTPVQKILVEIDTIEEKILEPYASKRNIKEIKKEIAQLKRRWSRLTEQDKICLAIDIKELIEKVKVLDPNFNLDAFETEVTALIEKTENPIGVIAPLKFDTLHGNEPFPLKVHRAKLELLRCLRRGRVALIGLEKEFEQTKATLLTHIEQKRKIIDQLEVQSKMKELELECQLANDQIETLNSYPTFQFSYFPTFKQRLDFLSQEIGQEIQDLRKKAIDLQFQNGKAKEIEDIKNGIVEFRLKVSSFLGSLTELSQLQTKIEKCIQRSNAQEAKKILQENIPKFLEKFDAIGIEPSLDPLDLELNSFFESLRRVILFLDPTKVFTCDALQEKMKDCIAERKEELEGRKPLSYEEEDVFLGKRESFMEGFKALLDSLGLEMGNQSIDQDSYDNLSFLLLGGIEESKEKFEEHRETYLEFVSSLGEREDLSEEIKKQIGICYYTMENFFLNIIPQYEKNKIGRKDLEKIKIDIRRNNLRLLSCFRIT